MDKVSDQFIGGIILLLSLFVMRSRLGFNGISSWATLAQSLSETFQMLFLGYVDLPSLAELLLQLYNLEIKTGISLITGKHFCWRRSSLNLIALSKSAKKVMS